MNKRSNWYTVAPGALAAMKGLEEYSVTNVDPALYELIKMRVSYLNGCAFCLDMHAHDAAKAGESTQRLILVSAWHEAKELFTAKEQAAFALAEEITAIGEHGVSDEVWAAAREQFTEKELADVVTAIVTINAWNRFAITFQAEIPKRS